MSIERGHWVLRDILVNKILTLRYCDDLLLIFKFYGMRCLCSRCSGGKAKLFAMLQFPVLPLSELNLASVSSLIHAYLLTFELKLHLCKFVKTKLNFYQIIVKYCLVN